MPRRPRRRWLRRLLFLSAAGTALARYREQQIQKKSGTQGTNGRSV